MIVFEPNSDFPFNNICLADPQPVQGGGTYFTRITINDEPINIQLQECNLKSGIVITSRSKYTDLMYSSERLPKELMIWIEEFENTIKNKIYEHRSTWFANDLTVDDIDTMLNPMSRFYMSEKKVLVRVHIDTDKKTGIEKCEVFDENEYSIKLDTLTAEDRIIPLLTINGIKFTTRSFQIDLKLTQLMKLDNLAIKGCQIKRNISKSVEFNDTCDTKTDEETDEEADEETNEEMVEETDADANVEVEVETNKETDTGVNVDVETNEETDTRAHVGVETNEETDTRAHVGVETNEEIDAGAGANVDVETNEETDTGANVSVETNEETNTNISAETNEETDVGIETNEKTDVDVEAKADVKTYTNNPYPIEIANSVILEDVEEINLGSSPTKSNLEEIEVQVKDTDTSMQLKKPNEVYYEIYRCARERAKHMRKVAVEAFLEAKQIKSKYMLEDIDDSDDSDTMSIEDGQF